jgi:alcohol dehydrogenase class IV
MPDFWQFSSPTKVMFGNGLSSDFAVELEALGISSAFLISDANLYKSGLLKPVTDSIRESGIKVIGPFTDVPANSSLSTVKACADFAVKNKADGIIALGGGSVLDTAKAANILITHGGDLSNDYSGAQTIPGPLKPLIAIPTTAGTGSEVTQAAVILDTERGTKLSFYDQYLHPSIAILDPLLLKDIPPSLMAATGWDAFTHAIEAYTSLQSNPFSDELALPAVRLIKEAFIPAVTKPKDLEAKGQMLLAATLAGIAFDQAMVGVVHAMAHACGGLSRAHHGTLNFILLPHGMEYNMPVAFEKYATLAKVLHVNPKFKSTKKLAHLSVKVIRKWQKKLHKICNLPLRLRDVGITRDNLGLIAKKACEDGTSFYNPREVEEQEILKTLERAW